MMRAVTTLSFMGLLVLGVGCQLSPQYKTNGFRWADSELPLVIDISGASGVGGLSAKQVEQAARDAMTAWNGATGRTLFVEGDSDNDVLISDISDPAIFSPVGGTSTFDIVVSSRYSFSVNPSGESGKYDLPTLLAHELGHALGLDHPVPDLPFGFGDLTCASTGGSDKLMCPRFQGQVMRSPGSGDLEGFWAIYGK